MAILRSLLNDQLRRVERLIDVVDVDTVENLEIHLECLFGYLHHIYDRGIAPSIVRSSKLCRLSTISAISDSLHNESNMSATCVLNQSQVGKLGRPKYDLPYDQLVYFVEPGFNCGKISEMLGVSAR